MRTPAETPAASSLIEENPFVPADPTLVLAQAFQTWWWMQHLPMLVFIFAFGGCVGSFINVVIYRLPAGMSIISPPSRCPVCGARLRFFTENLPILGWFLLRGKCRYCRSPISPQYMVVELTMALLFAFLYVALYMAPPSTPFLGAIGGPWWYSAYGVAFFRTWPAFIMLSFLLASLIAMTVIDARTFTILIQIPLFVTATAFIGWVVQALLPGAGAPNLWPMPGTDWPASLMAMGGILGVTLSTWLLRIGVFRYSFADYHDYVSADEVLGDYPHARREMAIELLFLLPCLIGLGLGWLLARFAPESAPPTMVQALGASFLGYLVGGGLIWGIRILGTLGFGREAMGLGDVHLMGAVGAVLGWVDPIWVFFIAPFSGLLWAALSIGLASMLKTARRELPYGPHLALGTFVVIFGREWILSLQQALAPFLPGPGLVP